MKHLTRPLFTVGVASSLVGVSAKTLRRWEAFGLIAPKRAGRSRRRLYSWDDIERLQQIRYLVTRKRVPLRRVKPMLRIPAAPAALPLPRTRPAGAPLMVPLAVPFSR